MTEPEREKTSEREVREPDVILRKQRPDPPREDMAPSARTMHNVLHKGRVIE